MIEPNSIWNSPVGMSSWWKPAVALLILLSPLRDARGSAPKDASLDPSVATNAILGGERPVAASASANSIRANLASVAAAAFEPGRDGVELASFGKTPVAAVLNVPPPGAMAPAAPATDHIPEPGAIGFGLAVAALIFGNFAKSLMRCWKITGTGHGRED